MKKIILVLALLIVHCSLYIENCNGQVWSPLGSGIDNYPLHLIVYNNELIAGGNFTIAGGAPANHIAKWNGTNWSPLGSGVDGNCTFAVYNNELIVGGAFDTAGGMPVSNIAKWNGTSWLPFGVSEMIGGTISHIAVHNGELIALGGFTSIGGVSANKIAKWNGTNWSPIGDGIQGFPGALAIYNNELYVGGKMLFWNDPLTTVAKWNGTTWTIVGGMQHVSETPYVSVLNVYNNELIAAGNFLSAGGVSAIHIAKWNGTNWSALGPGVISDPFALTVYNNELIVGGYIRMAGTLSVNNIVKWNGTSWSSLGSGFCGGYPNTVVYDLTVFNNTLIACGKFDTAGGIPAKNIAKWWTPFTISGSVKYADNSQIVTSGYVKAFRYDSGTNNIIVLDSALIQSDGSYILNNIPEADLYIGAVPNSSPPSDYVLTYYPSSIYWEKATKLHPTGNLTNINVNVYRLTTLASSNYIGGKVNSSSPVAPLKDANLYAKNGNNFVGFKSTGSNGVYSISSLPPGNLKIIADRMGYKSDSVTVNLGGDFLDSVNFYLTKLTNSITPISNAVSNEYKLYQNYPNPFNPNTIIRFQIKKLSSPHALGGDLVTLKVYDMLGKEVATLVNENLRAGEYEVTFNGSGLASGIYFYKLIAGDFTDVKRMILIK